MDKLKAFIEEVMEKEGLSVAEIERRSGCEITDSHIFKILKGKAKSIGVDKLNALAKGLGVSNVQLLRVVSGEEVHYRNEELWPSHLLSKAIDRIVHDPDLGAVVKALLKAKPAKIKAVKKVLEKE